MPVHRAVYIASEAILLARMDDSFRLPDLKGSLDLKDEQMPSNSTIRRVLQQLEASNWLDRDHPEGRTWEAGPHVNGEGESVDS